MSKNKYHNQNNAAVEVAAVPEVEPENAMEGMVINDEAVIGEKKRVSLSAEIEEEKPELIIELSKIYDFEGEEIEKVDLSGIENLSEKDQIKVDKIYRKITKNISSTPEFTPDFGVAMTHVLTGIPLEAVRQFSYKDKIRIKNAVMNFLYGND